VQRLGEIVDSAPHEDPERARVVAPSGARFVKVRAFVGLDVTDTSGRHVDSGHFWGQ
jgi:hypothetical protein